METLAPASKRVLVIAADPNSTSVEFLEEEIAICMHAAQQARVEPPRFEALSTLNLNALFNAISDFKPTMLQFTGHGSPTGVVVHEDEKGWVRNSSGTMIGKMLSALDPPPKFVLFNSCRLTRGVNNLVNVVEAALGFRSRDSTEDISSLVAESFYGLLGRPLSLQEVFKTMQQRLSELGLGRTVISKLQTRDDLRSARGAGGLPRDKVIPQRSSGEMAFAVDSAFGDEAKPKDKRTYRVWFGTNRKPVDPIRLSKGFGPERGTETQYGYCDVSIPKYHDIGSVGEQWWNRFPKFWRNNRLSVISRQVLARVDYLGKLKEYLSVLPREERTLLLFVHGYNTTFDQAAVRAAQIGFDLSIPGTTAFFSWPSKGSIKSYASDIASIEASEGAISDFVFDLTKESGAESVHVIAHSMGNRGLLRAMSNIFSRVAKKSAVKLQQIFLAAPDVDRELFKSLASVYVGVSTRTTMYVSSKDKALRSSNIIHDYPRAGFTPPITIIKGIDTVEVTNIDLSFFGHSYIAEVRAILQDMHLLMTTNTPPNDRFGLELMTDSAGSYWRIRS